MDHIMYIHSNPVPQRAHKKSTTGCKACKVRKVKCDEQKPVCRRCQVHFKNITSCDYESSRPSKRSEPPAAVQFVATEPTEPTLNKLSLRASSRSLDISSENAQRGLTLICLQNSGSKPDCCTCPCHHPEFTNLLLDAVFGVCRICDPFSVLPAKSTPRVHALMHHWTTTLALFPTQIHSQYCTNPTWLSAAIANPTLFNTTLYVASVHDAGLHGCRDTVESLFYKAQTIQVLNEALRNPAQAVSDETLSAVLLLTHIVSIIGEPEEVETHLNGLRQMINLRGGIQTFSVAGNPKLYNRHSHHIPRVHPTLRLLILSTNHRCSNLSLCLLGSIQLLLIYCMRWAVYMLCLMRLRASCCHIHGSLLRIWWRLLWK
ncbi:hypothetical protein BKA61DRAFT_116775 [Leptodontidium sp. MPI-SDFR-AT-0119]|nr:hypothetical protein BKA61DRAFT_116775 [Leptodontidium sp. MPI-SDFR-AT-0119]